MATQDIALEHHPFFFTIGESTISPSVMTPLYVHGFGGSTIGVLCTNSTTQCIYKCRRLQTFERWDFSRLFQKNIFLLVVGHTQLYFLSVLFIIRLSCILKVNNKLKHPAGPMTDKQGFIQAKNCNSLRSAIIISTQK